MDTENNEDGFRVMEDKGSDLDFSRLSSEVKSYLSSTKVAAILRSGKSIDILICGKTGCGKSTLINGLMGVKLMEKEAAKEGDSLTHCTTRVDEYKTIKDKITVTVWDTPGLLDGTDKQDDYLREIEDKCPPIHLKLFCISCSQTRFVSGPNNADNGDFLVMKKFTEAFGMEFWKNTVIVLTMANTVEAFKPKWKYLAPSDKQQEFTQYIDEFRSKIRSILEDDIKLDKDIVTKMKIVPAGHYDDRKLPGRDYWLSDFYFECLDAIPSPEAKGALLNLSLDRFKMKSEVVDSNFKEDAEMQPIVVDVENGFVIISETIENCSIPVGSASPNDQPTEGSIGTKGAAGIGSGVGGVLGFGLGFIGLLGGPLAFVTVPAGAAVGTAVGAGLGYVTKKIIGSSEPSASNESKTEKN